MKKIISVETFKGTSVLGKKTKQSKTLVLGIEIKNLEFNKLWLKFNTELPESRAPGFGALV